MSPFCPYCSEPTILDTKRSTHVDYMVWVCKICQVEILYAYLRMYIHFRKITIGSLTIMLQLIDDMPPTLYAYRGDEPARLVYIPESLVNQITPQNLEAKIRTFLTFS